MLTRLREWSFGRGARSRERSRVIVVLGMHRSGTSAVTRGVQALGVALGSDFLDAQPENPTGYWEDKGIVDLNERILKALGLTWDDAARIDPSRFESKAIRRLKTAASRYVRRAFGGEPLWGFKDPRTMRVLPLWRDVFQDNRLDDAYLLVVRNPMSVAKSLFARQRMPPDDALRLWLAYSLPYLGETAGKAAVVVDYDRFMQDPRGELRRICAALALDANGEKAARNIDRFLAEFLNERLRHTVHTIEEIDAATAVGRLTRDTYALLLDAAGDRRRLDETFWNDWEKLVKRFTSNGIAGAEATAHG